MIDNDLEQGAFDEVLGGIEALVIGGAGEEKIFFGQTNGELTAHSVEGKAAFSGAPDQIAVALGEGTRKADSVVSNPATMQLFTPRL